MKDLQNKAENLAAHLNGNGFNIETVITYNKDQIVFLKKVSEDTVILTQYFGIGWGAGVQLVFNVINGKLVFRKKGVFGFRTDVYDTPANNNTLNNLVQIAQNYPF